MRFRVMYEIKGLLAYLSHLDMMRLWQRAVLRSSLPITWSKGYNPRPRLSLGPAKGVGIAGCGEYIDVELEQFLPAAEITAKLNGVLPDDVRVLKVRELPPGTKLLEAVINGAEYLLHFPAAALGDAAERIAGFLALDTCLFIRKSPKGDKTIDLRSFVRHMELNGENLVLDVKIGAGGAVRPEEILTQLGYGDIIDEIEIARRSLYIEKNGGRYNP